MVIRKNTAYLFVDRSYHTTRMDILDLIHFDFSETISFNREKSILFHAITIVMIFLNVLYKYYNM